MSNQRLLARRLVTAAGVIAVLAIGFGSIRAAAAWTAASAPLTIAPVSVSSLESDLAAERSRSDALLSQLEALDARSRDLEHALAQAQSRVESDEVNADDLEAQLAAATKKLTKLEKAIAKAKKDLAARSRAATAAAARPASSGGGSSSHDDDEDEDEEDEEDDHEEDDD